jgi:hypothetical protein
MLGGNAVRFRVRRTGDYSERGLGQSPGNRLAMAGQLHADRLIPKAGAAAAPRLRLATG